jgi:hypothetical protein
LLLSPGTARSRGLRRSAKVVDRLRRLWCGMGALQASADATGSSVGTRGSTMWTIWELPGRGGLGEEADEHRGCCSRPYGSPARPPKQVDFSELDPTNKGGAARTCFFLMVIDSNDFLNYFNNNPLLEKSSKPLFGDTSPRSVSPSLNQSVRGSQMTASAAPPEAKQADLVKAGRIEARYHQI